jgi:amino-acid N-acetyltransferase
VPRLETESVVEAVEESLDLGRVRQHAEPWHGRKVGRNPAASGIIARRRRTRVRPTDLRGILQYIPQFREKTFIIAVDGANVTDENFGNLLMDVAVLWSLSIRVVLVHGAAAQIQKLAGEKGFTPSDLEGGGVTDAETLALALTASNRLTHEVLEGLSANDLRAATTNAIVAHPLGILHGVDHLFTGKVDRVDVGLLQGLLGQGVIPVVAPLGFDGDGKTYRLNSDAVAVELARALGAVKLVFVTTTDGLPVEGSLARQITVADLSAAIQRGAVAPELLSKARHAVAACNAGVGRVHVINGLVDEGLLAEVFSNEGIGTLIYASEYQEIRRARKKDVRTIQALIRASVESEELVRRTQQQIERQIDDYYIFETDRNPVACVALHVSPAERVGELACLFVRSSHENQGVGKKLVHFVENRARELGLERLLALSTQAFNFFISKVGFSEGTPDDLPAARREKYEQSGRRSKILVKRLS